MYLKEVRLWNFRKYGTRGDNGELPGLTVKLHKKFNLIIGENDSGKTAIIDAIKLTLGTSSEDTFRITEDDFHVSQEGIKKDLKIICLFSDLNETEAGQFLEWLSFDENGEYELQVNCSAKWTNDVLKGERIERTVTAGPEHAASRLEGVTRELIRATYLKPLRDAEIELKPGLRSRLAQILKSHKAFQRNDLSNKHELEEIMEQANEQVASFFDKPYEADKTIKTELNKFLEQFFTKSPNGERAYDSDFKITQVKLNDILRRLSLELSEIPSGLGSLNLLFIATELLLHNADIDVGANVTLIEEIEAHLHPQAQLRLIKYLQHSDNSEINGQFILTSHSTTLAASTKLEHVILMSNNVAFPMGKSFTKLDGEDYKFLERFLDSTKANIFFAKGVIFVEGDAENLLLPAVAEILDRPLHQYGVSIVNIGNTAFKRYSKIFSRSDEWLKNFPPLQLPVSIITDVDVRATEYYEDHGVNGVIFSIQSEEQLKQIAEILAVETSDISNLLNVVFTGKREVAETFGLLPSDRDETEQILNVLRSELSAEVLDSLREKKKEALKANYEEAQSNIKVFVAPKWTLEYEIAQSGIWELLIHAIHSVTYKHPQKAHNIKRLEEKKRKLRKLGNDDQRAYYTYKPLLDKNVSKASVAQELAQLMILRKAEIAELVRSDTHLLYLTEAIYHVTGGAPQGD